MDRIAADRIEVRRQGCHQRFTLSGTHLRNLAVIKDHPADQLHIEVTHFQCTPRYLPDHGKGFSQKLLEPLTRSRALAKLASFCLEVFVRKRLKRGLECVNLIGKSAHLAQKPLIAAAENFGCYLAEHRIDLLKMVKWACGQDDTAPGPRPRALASSYKYTLRKR